MATALQLFRTQGFAATTMDQVAAASRVSKHTLYRRFPSKALLFRAAITQHAESLLDRLDVLGQDKAAPLNALRLAFEESLRFSTSDEAIGIFRLCIAEVSRIPEVGDQFRNIEQHILDRIEPLVRHAQMVGGFRDGDPRDITAHLFYTMVGPEWIKALTGRPPELDDEILWTAFEVAWKRALHGVMRRVQE